MKDTAIRVTLGEVLVIITVMVAFYASNVLAIQLDAGQQGVDFEKIAKAAAAGDAIQQYNYGVMHETGQGVQQSMASYCLSQLLYIAFIQFMVGTRMRLTTIIVFDFLVSLAPR